MLAQTVRAATANGWLIFRVPTVARPQAVSPSILRPSSRHRKCSCQSCWRGLKRSTSSPPMGSAPWVCTALAELQAAQASAKLAIAVGPPKERGCTWSNWCARPMSHSAWRQYSHRPAALNRTDRRSPSGTRIGLRRIYGEVRQIRQRVAALGQNRHCLRSPEYRAAVALQQLGLLRYLRHHQRSLAG